MSTNSVSSKPVAIIPGASRPFGRAIARRFSSAGFDLVLPWFDWPESVKEMTAEFQAGSSEILSCRCDLRNEQEVHSLFSQIEDAFGRIDCLINNIERGGMPIVHGSYNLPHNRGQWELEFETTLKAKWLLYTNAFNLLKASQGSVVNISSIAGECGRSGPAACFFNDGYSAANNGVRNLTTQWAREGAPDIRVNELMVGLVNGRHGENTRGWQTLSSIERQGLKDHTLLNRLGEPEEVAEAVYFLATGATFMTGSTIVYDGGYLLGGDRVPPMPSGILEEDENTTNVSSPD